jgi:hypothetical protein
VEESGLADTVEKTVMQSASTIKIAILLFMVASLVKAPVNIVAIMIPTYRFIIFKITY